MNPGDTLPVWMDRLVLPAVNVALALAVCAAVLAAAGHDPAQALASLLRGAFGSRLGLSYTLYYATTFVFTGLAVAVALHAGLFNIGGEGQATLGGLGVALVALAWADRLPAALLLPLMVLAAMLAGMAWAAVPAALQAWRGSHVVITTVMFNLIASALLGWLLVDVLQEPGNMAPESRAFGDAARMPGVHELLGALGWDWPASPLNLSLLLALAALPATGWLLWRSPAGYAMRACGFSPEAARYAGIAPPRQAMVAMAVAGALAGLVGVNEIAGVQGRLIGDFVAGAGFAGIAVALIGRNHPVGIALAALGFGALHQGGAELSFELPGFPREMVTTLQGLVVLFAGAMGRLAAPALRQVHRRLAGRGRATEAARG